MNLKKYLVEFIGAFFLIATIGFTVLKPGDAGNLAPLAIGSALMVMVFAGGAHLGGALQPRGDPGGVHARQVPGG